MYKSAKYAYNRVFAIHLITINANVCALTTKFHYKFWRIKIL